MSDARKSDENFCSFSSLDEKKKVQTDASKPHTSDSTFSIDQLSGKGSDISDERKSAFLKYVSEHYASFWFSALLEVGVCISLYKTDARWPHKRYVYCTCILSNCIIDVLKLVFLRYFKLIISWSI